jgi:hypothetical protein
MARFPRPAFLLVLALSTTLAIGQKPTRRVARKPSNTDQRAAALAAQSIAALTGGSNITDATLTGSGTWSAGFESETGAATFLALGTGESRMDLVLPSGTRTEVRDSQTGALLGKWIDPSGTSGSFAIYNCQTDAAWFFPALGSLAAGPNVVLSYVGQETRTGASVQHIRSYESAPQQIANSTLQQLSTMDFYLDSTTLLPAAVTFNLHPDNDATANIMVEIDLLNYQNVSNALVPMHIQEFRQGNLLIDVSFTSILFNTGLSLSTFTIE